MDTASACVLLTWACMLVQASCAAVLSPQSASAPLPLGASASSWREGHTAASAFDATSATYWQSSTPAAGSWLSYVFPSNQTVLQYALTSPDDARYAASDGAVAWELQASGDGGKTWTPVDRRVDQPLWRPAETRVFTAKYPGNAGGEPSPFPAFRLVVVKVPGRTVDQSFVSVADFRFLTRETLPPLCDVLDSVRVNVTAAGVPPPAVNDTATGVSAAPTAAASQLFLYINITNAGVNPVSLRDVHAPVRFSRGVQSWDGVWGVQPPATFNLSCWGLYIVDPDARPNAKQTDLCGMPDVARLTMQPWGVDIYFKRDTLLCPGCTLTGPPPARPGAAPVPSFEVQHSSYGRLDADTVATAPLQCGGGGGGATIPQPPELLPVPGAERHPACAPWAGNGNATPACAPSEDLAQLSLSLAYSYVDGPPDPRTGQPQRARELRLRPTLRNYGPRSVPLFGATFTITFPHGVSMLQQPGPDGQMVTATDPVTAPGFDFTTDCFWGQVVTKDNVPVYGQRPVCEYLSAAPNDSGTGIEVTFLGGALCAGCTLAGASGTTDAVLNVKHAQYAQLATSPPAAVQGGATCEPPSAPPSRCTSAAPPQQL